MPIPWDQVPTVTSDYLLCMDVQPNGFTTFWVAWKGGRISTNSFEHAITYEVAEEKMTERGVCLKITPKGFVYVGYINGFWRDFWIGERERRKEQQLKDERNDPWYEPPKKGRRRHHWEWGKGKKHWQRGRLKRQAAKRAARRRLAHRFP